MKNLRLVISLVLTICAFALPTVAQKKSSIGTVYSEDQFGGKSFSLSETGVYAIDTGCSNVLGLPVEKTLGFRPRSVKVQAGYRIKLIGGYGNPGDTHCEGPSFSRIPATCLNSPSIYGQNCLNKWVYENVGGAFVIEKDDQSCDPPLSTSNRYIVDSCGKRMKLKSFNWGGASDRWEVVIGLHKQSLHDLVSRIKSLGFNSVRLPFSNKMLHPDNNKSALERCRDKYKVECISGEKNPQLVGKTALEVYDSVVNELTRQGLLVILNNHSTHSMWCCGWPDGNGFWNSSQSLEDWQNDWIMMVKRYKTNRLVVGADLRNEVRPDGLDSPNWGWNNRHDWHLAAQTMGNLILGANPEMLIVVEAINWWGLLPRDPYRDPNRPGLRPVRTLPIVLSRDKKLVYAMHEYGYTGPSRGNSSWGRGPSYADMSREDFFKQMDAEWGFVLETGKPYTAPVWISEFGAAYNENEQKMKNWMNNLADYMNQKNVDWAYWQVNATKLQYDIKGEEEAFGLLTYPEWDSVRSDWRFGTGPLGRLLSTPLGKAREVSVGANGVIWAIGTDSAPGGFGVYRWDGQRWVKQPGLGAVKVSVDSRGTPWLINDKNEIWAARENRTWERFLPALAAREISTAEHISPVWAIGTDPAPGGFGVHYLQRPSRWVRQPPPLAAVKVAADPKGKPWLINDQNEIWMPSKDTWVKVLGKASEISVGANGDVWVIGLDPEPGGFGVHRWDGTTWIKQPGLGAVKVAVDPSGGLWLINNEKNIWFWSIASPKS